MLIQIRQGAFETNSSSTHAVVILTEEEYKGLKSGDLLISRHGKISKASEVDEEDKEYEYDQENMDLIHCGKEIKGEKVYAVSVYGYDY